MSASKILFAFTGSITCYQACEVLRRLVRLGYFIRVAATPAALRFVGASTLEAITGSPVTPLAWGVQEGTEHLPLATWADALVVGPATASVIASLSAGLNDDFLSELFLMHYREKPRIIIPSMTAEVWRHPSTQKATGRLTEWGAQIIPLEQSSPEDFASSDELMPSPEETVLAIESSIIRPERRLRILVTTGETTEIIDGLRMSAHSSTPHIGTRFARLLSRLGHRVELLACRPAASEFEEDSSTQFFRRLQSAVATQEYDLVLHAASSGRFKPVSMELTPSPPAGELHHEYDATVRLRRTTEDVELVRTKSLNPRVVLARFSLSRDESEDSSATRDPWNDESKGSDYILSGPTQGRQDEQAYWQLKKKHYGVVARPGNDAEAIRALANELLFHDSAFQ